MTDSGEQSEPSQATTRTTRSRVKPYALPPCKVCGAKATGFHYGVNTCAACKGFFRRALDHKDGYTCRKTGKCRVQTGQATRTGMCPACRYSKCLEVGMSVEGSKQGRYTLQRHHHNTVEVKKLQAKEAEVKHQIGDNKQRLMRHLVANIVDSYTRIHGELTGNLDSEMSETMNTFVEKRRLTEGVFGSLSPVSYDDFKQIYEGTGLQVDDRLNMWQTWVAPVDTSLKNKVKFAKSIPGFNDLDLEDQAILLKAAFMEGWLIVHHNTFNVDHKCFVECPGREFELEKLFGEDFAELILTVVRRLQHLKLHSDEKIMLSAFIYVTPDRSGLKAPDKVSEIQNQLLDAILWLLKKNRPADPSIFPKLVSVLTDLRNVAEFNRTEAPRFLIKLMDAGHLKLPQILRELAAE